MVFQDTSLALSVSAVAAVALPVTLLLVLMVCLPCFRKKIGGGFSVPAASSEPEENFSNTTDTANSNQAHSNTVFSPDIEDTSIDAVNTTVVTIEPLPDVANKSKLPTCPLRPRIGSMEKSKQDASLKMIAMHHPFPRSQIVYLKELGTGWFGKVIESDAEKINVGVPRTRVVVKMLKDDASKDEQQLFCQEVAPFRELEHTNVMRLLGQCTETNPMLMIVEAAAFGNLKQYLRSHRNQQAALIQKNRLIQFALDAASGLACLHAHGYLHKDLAARNCLVMGSHTLKIGDYGIAEDLFKEDYMTSGNELLPIRWMAPETLKQENGTWSSHNFSKESDVWSLGVLIWEITMLGERPYDMLTDEAVLQGVIMDKDIRLPEPDIGIPNKDRLHEVMRFCWMEQSDRTKVDEVHKLLQQIASKVPENGTSGDAITAFEQKWEHLMPNQRHSSVDSIDDRLGSFSSEDSNLPADNLLQPSSLEDLTAPAGEQLSPQAPPRSSRKKVSAPAISIPRVDEVSETPTSGANKTVTEMTKVVPPQINIFTAEGDLATSKTQQPQMNNTPKIPEKSVEPKQKHDSETEFTEFTSHDVSDIPVGGTPDVSQVIGSVAASPDTQSKPQHVTDQKVSVVNDDPFQIGPLVASSGDVFSQLQSSSGDDSFVMKTPEKQEPRARKTSTPIAKDESSPSSTSSLSAGDSSSATYLTAHSSSPGNFTDAYATASDSTVVTDHNKISFTASSDFSAFEELPSSTAQSSLSFEILETTAVPSVLNDFDQSAESSHGTPVPNVHTGDSDSIHKDDSFGEFTNASAVEENHESSPKDASGSSESADITLSGGVDASTTPSDFFSFVGETRTTVPSAQSNKSSPGNTSSFLEDKPAVQTEDPFASFGTDLSSLNSLTVPTAAESAGVEEPFPSFTSDLSSLNSLNTSSDVTPQAGSQSNPFAFDQTVPPTKPPAQSSSTSIENTNFSLLGSVPDVANSIPTEDLAVKSSTMVVSSQPTPDLFGDLVPASVPTEKDPANSQFAGFSDVFGMGDAAPGKQDNVAALDPKEGNSVTEPPSTLSDFDLLSGFSASSANTQSASSNPFIGGGGLLQDFADPPQPTVPASTQKVGNGVDNFDAHFSREADASGVHTDSASNMDSCKDPSSELCAETTEISPSSSNKPHITVINVKGDGCASHFTPEFCQSKDIQVAGPCETSAVDPVPEDHALSVSEESSAPTPSETGSVDVKLEDVFEWDDFIGEPLVGKERYASESESPKQSFDMPDWTLDMDSESIRSGSSFRSLRSDGLHKKMAGPDSHSTSSAETPNACSSVSDSEESQDDVLVANTSGQPNRSEDTSLFSFMEFESSSSATSAADGTSANSKPSSEVNSASLIDF